MHDGTAPRALRSPRARSLSLEPRVTSARSTEPQSPSPPAAVTIRIRGWTRLAAAGTELFTFDGISILHEALRRNSNLSVGGVVQDGAHETLNTMRYGLEQLRSDGARSRLEEGIDRYHLLERLAAALELAENDATHRRNLRHGWNEPFDIQDSTIDALRCRLRRQSAGRLKK
jgi:hypothetical protein